MIKEIWSTFQENKTPVDVASTSEMKELFASAHHLQVIFRK